MLITPNLCKSIEDIIKFLIIVNNIKSCPYRKILLNWWYKHQVILPKIIELFHKKVQRLSRKGVDHKYDRSARHLIGGY